MDKKPQEDGSFSSVFATPSNFDFSEKNSENNSATAAVPTHNSLSAEDNAQPSLMTAGPSMDNDPRRYVDWDHYAKVTVLSIGEVVSLSMSIDPDRSVREDVLDGDPALRKLFTVRARRVFDHIASPDQDLKVIRVTPSKLATDEASKLNTRVTVVSSVRLLSKLYDDLPERFLGLLPTTSPWGGLLSMPTVDDQPNLTSQSKSKSTAETRTVKHLQAVIYALTQSPQQLQLNNTNAMNAFVDQLHRNLTDHHVQISGTGKRNLKELLNDAINFAQEVQRGLEK